MTELYLIAHKVRGEPAFDIAHKLEIGDEEGWIIPTSGHRAYPYWSTPLMELVTDLGPALYDGGFKTVGDDIPSMPTDLPEHYEVSAAPKGKGSGINGRDLLAKLGMLKPREPMSRRSW